MDRAKQRSYSAEERSAVLKRADEVGVVIAAAEAGIPEGTVSSWRFYERRRVAAAAEVSAPQAVPTVPSSESVAPAEEKVAAADGKTARKVAKSYTPSQRAETLEHAAKHGVTAAAKKFGTTRFSIYSWQRQIEQHAQGKAKNNPVVGSDEDTAAVRDQRILKEWRAHPGLGPSQVRNQLRRQGMKVSIHTVRCVLEDNGYVSPKVRRVEAHDQRYEAVRPNHLWHLDFLHRHIHKQKVYLLLVLDDYSRFIVGGALWEGERVAAVRVSQAVWNLGR